MPALQTGVHHVSVYYGVLFLCDVSWFHCCFPVFTLLDYLFLIFLYWHNNMGRNVYLLIKYRPSFYSLNHDEAVNSDVCKIFFSTSFVMS